MHGQQNIKIEQTNLHSDGTQTIDQCVSVYRWHGYVCCLSSTACALPKWAVSMKWLRFRPISIHFVTQSKPGLVT